jgi:Major Facilitator Superfamily
MPESSVRRAPRPDGVGTLLCAAAMGLLVYPLIQGRQAGWPLWTYLMMAASVLAAGLLAGWSRGRGLRGHGTLVETSVFRHRGYSAGLACVVVFFAGMAGTLLALTLYLQFGEHFSAMHAGLTLAPFAAGSAAGAVTAATVVVPRLGRGALQVAAGLIAAGTWWLDRVISAHGLATTSAQLIPAQLILGAGIGMLISPLFDFILASVSDREVGSASGVLNAVQQLASAIGVAVIGTVFFGTLSRSGFVAAISQCLKIELGVAAALFAAALALPRRARDPQAPAETGAADVPGGDREGEPATSAASAAGAADQNGDSGPRPPAWSHTHAATIPPAGSPGQAGEARRQRLRVPPHESQAGIGADLEAHAGKSVSQLGRPAPGWLPAPRPGSGSRQARDRHPAAAPRIP